MIKPGTATIIDVPDDQPNIQAGIDASTDGDTVRVAEGTYVENINFNGKNIVVGSWFLDDGDPSYIATTIIDGNAAASVVIFANGENNTAAITGFTIQNGSAMTGAGIRCSYASPSIKHNVINGNIASGGGGIYCTGSDISLTISHNTISGNTAYLEGGGISCEYNADPTINNNIISGNSASDGGGISCKSSSNPMISDNTIEINYASERGGGVYCDLSDPTIEDNTINGNNGYSGGGGITCATASPTINNNLISGNSPRYGGGIQCIAGSYPEISNNTISGNSADQYGGGILCYGTFPIISGNTISGNTASSRGGGIYCEAYAHPTIVNNTIYGNSASPYGGGLCCIDHSYPVVRSTILWANTAYSGDQIYYDDWSPNVSYSDIQGGWEGDGNIDCDPLFCDPENGNFYLDVASCCIGTGYEGVDIGAFGVGCGVDIPTLSEWGMLIMALLLLAVGTVAVVRRRKVKKAARNIAL